MRAGRQVAVQRGRVGPEHTLLPRPTGLCLVVARENCPVLTLSRLVTLVRVCQR